jgi:hypothetical protein
MRTDLLTDDGKLGVARDAPKAEHNLLPRVLTTIGSASVRVARPSTNGPVPCGSLISSWTPKFVRCRVALGSSRGSPRVGSVDRPLREPSCALSLSRIGHPRDPAAATHR